MRLFVTGIGTEVGKTIIAAILTEALEADYWKPIQAGDLHHSDTDKVKALVTNNRSIFYKEAFCLQQPMSPHAAAEKDGINVHLSNIRAPKTNNHLIIEGAGGLMVPLNYEECIIDLILQLNCEVVLVSRNYLGSINHTLLSIEALQKRGILIKGIIFNGAENKETEKVILKMANVSLLGRVWEEKGFDPIVIRKYAAQFKESL